MIALIRLAALVIGLEALFYVLISLYVRSLQRERLEKQWDARHPEIAGDSETRRDFVRKSMVGFEKTLRARLVMLVLILPFVAIMATIYLVNYA